MIGSILVLLVVSLLSYFTLKPTVDYFIEYFKLKKTGAPFGTLHFFNPHMNPIAKYFQTFNNEDDRKELLNLFKTSKVVIMNRGSVYMALVKDAKLIRDIAIKKSKSYEKPTEMYQIFEQYGPNVLTSEGETWKTQRNFFNPVFSQEKYFETFVDHVVKYGNKFMDMHLQSNETRFEYLFLKFNISEKIKHLTLDILANSVFGVEINALTPKALSKYKKDEIPKDVTMTFLDSLNFIIYGIVWKSLGGDYIAPFIPIEYVQKIAKATMNFEAHMKFIIEKSKRDSENIPGLLQLMINSIEGNESFELTEKSMMSNTMIYLFAGHETTAVTINWVIREMCANPQVQEKVSKIFFNISSYTKNH
jgi:cytochrome P450